MASEGIKSIVHSSASGHLIDPPLVTGANGFVGRHFCSRFGGVPLLHPNGDIVDLRDAAQIQDAIQRLQPKSAVIHLAAQSSVASSFTDPGETYAVNFLGTLHLLTALRDIGFRGVFIYISSADVYGRVPDSALPVHEDFKPSPRSPYAVSKIAAEMLCYQWSQTEAFRVIVVRPFNQIGPGHDRRFAIPDFACQIVEIRKGLREPRMVTGNIDVTRDFTDVRDTTRALHALLQNGRNGEVYNICSGRERTLRSVIEEMFDIAGVKAELATDTSRIRAVEQQRMAGDFKKLYEHLGWKPELSLRTTLEDILKDAEDQLHV